MKQSVPSRSILRRISLAAAFLSCLIASFFALRELNHPLIGIDDANIYFVYARNLANGYGFVYNVGGERVEGFTSLLWTLLSTLAFKFTGFPEITLLFINITLVSLGIAYALDYLQLISFTEGKSWWAVLFWSVLYLVIIFTSPRYVVWNTITLMENALWSTLLLLTAIFIIKDHGSSREINASFLPLSILLLLTRPESILWVAVFLAVLFLRLAFTGGFLHALKTLAPSLLGIFLTLASLTVFRLQYFGYPLPNTYYAKVSPSFAYNLEQGTLYLIRYLISDPVVTVSVASIVLACIYSFRRFSLGKGEFYVPLLAATGLLVPLLTGGDHFGSFRFYQNTYPITILCLIYFLHKIIPKLMESPMLAGASSGRYSIILPALVLLLMVGFGRSQAAAWSQFPPEIQAEFDIAKYERANGVFIQNLFSSLSRLPSVGVIAAGGIKVTYEGEIVDLAGLNNTMMAHNHGNRVGHKGHAAFEVDTFYKLQPDILLPFMADENWQYSKTELEGRWENTLAFKGLFGQSQFLELYQYAKVCKASGSGCQIALVGWFKKDFLESLLQKGDCSVEQYEYTP